MADTHILERKAPRTGAAAPAGALPGAVARRPSYQAYRLLQIAFVAAPILAGLDKYFHLLTNWDMYLSGTVEQALPFSGHTFMLIVGVVEIVAGLLVAVVPRIGAWVVAAWLSGIIINLLLVPGWYDIALRDFGLALGAVALGLLSWEFGGPRGKKAPHVGKED